MKNMRRQQRYRDDVEDHSRFIDHKKYYDDDDDDEEEFGSFDDDAYIAQGGSSLNTGRKTFFYNDMNPNHTRGVFIMLCLAFCFLIFFARTLLSYSLASFFSNNTFDALLFWK